MEDASMKKIILIDSCKMCGRSLKEEWNFCPYCNYIVETLNCFSCNKIIKVNWEYCPYCKSNLKKRPTTEQLWDNNNQWLRHILNH